MSIDYISSYGGFYNQYRMPEIPRVSVEDVKKQDEQVNEVPVSPATEPEQQPVSQASRMANLEDISLSFNVNETYDYIGRDADLQNLDMMKAISDMQKDAVLEQYQYFVGPKDITGPVISQTPDGMVIQK